MVEAAFSIAPSGRAHVVGPEALQSGQIWTPSLPPATPFRKEWRAVDWVDVAAVRWKYADAIHLGETRAVNLWLEIISRMPSMACTKIVDLCDR